MKKNLYLTTIAVLAAFTFVSCNQFLDVRPAGRLIPGEGDVESFNRLLNNTNTIGNIYSNNNGGCLTAYLSDNLEISDNQEKYAWEDGAGNMEMFYAHIFQMPYGNPDMVDYNWDWGVYRAAVYFNLVIDGINDVKTPETERQAKEIIAQATVARAWGYYMLALGLGPVYKPGGDNSRKVLPYRTTSSPAVPIEDLSTMQEIMDRVSADIHSVMGDIPENVTSNTRFGKVASYAFLADYHLFTQQFDSVTIYANKALELAAKQQGGMNNLFYDMNMFTWADARVDTNPDARQSSDITPNQGVVPLRGTGATVHREICLHRTPGGVTNCYPSADLLALFDETTDLRREYYFFEYDGFLRTIGKVRYDDGRRIMDYQTKIQRTVGYSYPEILLMRAEGRARTGDVAGALADLNYLRKLRHRTGTQDLVITGQDNIILEVLNERKRELQAGSPKRFFELKRLCLDTGKPWCKTSITHSVGGKTYTAQVDSEHFILPIRNRILRFNPQWGIELDERPWSNIKIK